MKRRRSAAFLMMTALLALALCGCGETQNTKQVRGPSEEMQIASEDVKLVVR